MSGALTLLAEIAEASARHGFGRSNAPEASAPSWATKRLGDVLIVLAGIALALPLIVLGA